MYFKPSRLGNLKDLETILFTVLQVRGNYWYEQRDAWLHILNDISEILNEL